MMMVMIFVVDVVPLIFLALATRAQRHAALPRFHASLPPSERSSLAPIIGYPFEKQKT